ncbi:MAG TPA: methyltransferase, partial [Dehalococcoidia bacterium]|nr:methyltransferase [Dehalococcoidia bacterium]
MTTSDQRAVGARASAMVAPNPFQIILETAGGYVLPRCLHVVADLGVGDALDDTPHTTAELAAAVGAHPDALGRILRLLAAHGIFALEGDTFRHTPPSQLLRSDHPQSMRAFVRLFGSSLNWASYGELEYTVRTGLPAKDKFLPEGLWAYYAAHPDDSATCNAAMVGKAHGAVAAIVAGYDFSGFGRIGDIGGGRGHLLQAVLTATPTAKGVLFDLPHVTANADAAASERLALQAGDFFRDALPSCDAYLLMEVIHDWGDAEAVAILQAIRRAAPDHAKLLLIEQLRP